MSKTRTRRKANEPVACTACGEAVLLGKTYGGMVCFVDARPHPDGKYALRPWAHLGSEINPPLYILEPSNNGTPRHKLHGDTCGTKPPPTVFDD